MAPNLKETRRIARALGGFRGVISKARKADLVKFIKNKIAFTINLYKDDDIHRLYFILFKRHISVLDMSEEDYAEYREEIKNHPYYMGPVFSAIMGENIRSLAKANNLPAAPSNNVNHPWYTQTLHALKRQFEGAPQPVQRARVVTPRPPIERPDPEYKIIREEGKAFKESASSVTYHPDKDIMDTRLFLNKVKLEVMQDLHRGLTKFRTIKWQLKLQVILGRRDSEETSTVFVQSAAIPLLSIGTLDYSSVLEDLEHKLDAVAVEKSGWFVKKIVVLYLNIWKYNPVRGGTWIPTPRFIASKNACVNIKNKDDQECFKWSVLAHLHPAARDADRLTKYREFKDSLDFTGITFPVKIDQIPRFERKNNLSVNVYLYEAKEGYVPLHISENPLDDARHIDLLMITGEKTRYEGYNVFREEVQHYILIKNFSRLSMNQSRDGHMLFYCKRCLHAYTAERLLIEHKKWGCGTTRTTMPEAKTTHKFKKFSKQLEAPVVIYADFETILVETQESKDHKERDSSYTLTRDKHHVCSYGFCVSGDVARKYETDTKTSIDYFSYRGDGKVNVIDHFIETLKTITDNLVAYINEHTTEGKRCVPMVMTLDDCKAFIVAEKCHICGRTMGNDRVRDHDHFTGKYRGAAHKKCNLTYFNYKHPKIVVAFHNMSRFDAHFFVNSLHKLNPQIKDVIANNSETYKMIDCGNVRFIDSTAFLKSALDSLAESLGPNDFIFTKAVTDDPAKLELIKKKGIYPYEYMNSYDRFNETSLPPKEAFYSMLKSSAIKDSEYEHGKDVWNTFECKTLGDYHDLYLKTDVLLLADIFTSFRKQGLIDYELDPAHYISIPSFAWDALFKKTGAEIELISDPDMYAFVEKGIRGGICVANTRMATANNKYLKDSYDETKESNYLLYLDINSMYAKPMLEPLATGDYEMVNPTIITPSFIEQWDIDGPKVYLVEVDIDYPASLHDLHNDYPLAPEAIAIDEKMLSPYQIHLKDRLKVKTTPIKKLVPNLKDKRNYVCHIANLQQYLKRGLVLRKVHRVMKFSQRAWMAPFIEFNTAKRKQAATKFEKDFYKLMNNSVFGKTMENVRERMSFNLVTDDDEAQKFIAKPTFKGSKTFSETLIGIERRKTQVTLDKPILVGLCILDKSKIEMMNFHYDTIKPRYGDNATVMYTDTDSLIYNIKTPDLYADMGEADFKAKLDLSNYEAKNALHDTTNAGVVGKMKDETAGKPIKEVVCLRAKMYSVFTPDGKNMKKAKGVTSSVVKAEITHQHYVSTLINEIKLIHKNPALRSFNHQVFTTIVNKTSLSCYDDKRFLRDAVQSYAHGSWRTQGDVMPEDPVVENVSYGEF